VCLSWLVATNQITRAGSVCRRHRRVLGRCWPPPIKVELVHRRTFATRDQVAPNSVPGHL